VAKGSVREVGMGTKRKVRERVVHQTEGGRTVVSNKVWAIIVDHVVN